MKALSFCRTELGILILFFGGHPSLKSALNAAPVAAATLESDTYPLAPILGVISIVGGGLLNPRPSKE